LPTSRSMRLRCLVSVMMRTLPEVSPVDDDVHVGAGDADDGPAAGDVVFRFVDADVGTDADGSSEVRRAYPGGAVVADGV